MYPNAWWGILHRKSGEPTGWNPFALEATKRNRIFVKQLMEILCTRNGERLSTRERLLISESVDAVMDFPPRRNAGIWHYQNA